MQWYKKLFKYFHKIAFHRNISYKMHGNIWSKRMEIQDGKYFQTWLIQQSNRQLAELGSVTQHWLVHIYSTTINLNANLQTMQTDIVY